MLSLDGTQLAIVASAGKTVSWLFDVTDSYRPAFFLLIAHAIVGSVLIAFLKSPGAAEAIQSVTVEKTG